MMMVDTVLLYSGGLDSECVRVLWPADRCVYVTMNTGYEGPELKAAHRAVPDLTVVSLPLDQWERPDGIIPLRNLMLVCVAAQYGDVVQLAATAGDRVLDKSVEFASQASTLLSFLWQPQHWTDGRVISVDLPAKPYTKRDLVRMAMNAGAKPEALGADTFSCYSPTRSGEPCRACKPCWRKWVALAANGLAKWAPDARAVVIGEVLPLIAAGTLGRRSEELDVLAAFGIHDPENASQAARWLLDRQGRTS